VRVREEAGQPHRSRRVRTFGQLSESALARSDDEGTGEGADASRHVHDAGARKVDHACGRGGAGRVRGGGGGIVCWRGGERGTSEHRVLVKGGEEAVFVPHPAAREKGVTAVQTSATPPGLCSPSPGLAPGLGA